MDNRGQTTFEYLLLVGGVVVLAALVIYMLTTSIKTSGSEVNKTTSGVVSKITEEANEIAQNIEATP